MPFQNHYYSGQGILWVGERDATGRPKSMRRVGNIPELTINIEVTKFEHKESESGNRLKDLVIIQEKNGTFSFTLENIDLDNLALGLWGSKASVAGASVTNETSYLEAGMRSPLKHPGISTVVVEADASKVPDWTLNTAIAVGEYRAATGAGTHYFVATVAGTTSGTEPTWNVSGSTTTDGTVTWQDAGVLPTAALTITTDYVVDAGLGALSTPDNKFPYGLPVIVDYAYAAYTRVDAFTQANAPERYLRFEGVNTVDGKKVIVEFFKAQFDPLTGYGLINEELGTLTMNGSLLADTLQVAGSQYFKQINL